MQREANNLTSKLHCQAKWKIDSQHLSPTTCQKIEQNILPGMCKRKNISKTKTKQYKTKGKTETDKKSTNLSLVGHHLNEVISTHIIHVWNKNRQEIRAMILWINVLLHSCIPVFPLTWGKFLEKFRTSRYDQLIKPQLHRECFAFYVAFDWNESHGGKRHIDSFQW